MATKNGSSNLKPILPIIGLFGVVLAVVATGTIVFPETLIQFMVGYAFMPVVDVLWMAASAAIFFTGSYFIAMVLRGMNDGHGVKFVMLTAAFQIVIVLAILIIANPMITSILWAKLAIQAILFAYLSFYVARRISAQSQKGNA